VIARRALAVIAFFLLMTPPALAARPQGAVVEVSAPDGAYLEMGGRRYRGPFRITAESDGVAVVEVVPLDAYLEGIREVPFSWHADALAAQVVAARTYLAWTLLGGAPRPVAASGTTSAPQRRARSTPAWRPCWATTEIAGARQ